MRNDITGMTFGRLTALRPIGVTSQRRIWEFQCSCGNLHRCPASDVRSGNTQSCGCWKLEAVATMGKTYGAMNGKANARPLETRFWSKVDTKNRPMPETCRGFGPCLLWTGGVDTNGRAQMGMDGTTKRASHVAWFLAYGVWPEYLLHRCDNIRCVDHLVEGNDDLNRYDRMLKELGGVQIT